MNMKFTNKISESVSHLYNNMTKMEHFSILTHFSLQSVA